jgi:hypothetical protein
MDYHAQARAVVVDVKTGLPHWETRCGIDMSKKQVGITSNRKDLTCVKCKGMK